MNNITTDVRFSTSNTAQDICLARAKYHTEKRGEALTKKNINKHYKRCLKEHREQLSNNIKHIVGFLHCSKTNAEVGFYLKTSYSEWDSLSILFVNPAFRGQRHAITLINLYEMDCKEDSVIELSSEHFEEQKSLYEYAGYTKTVGGLFPTSIALIKENSLESISKAIDADSISYESIYQNLVKITKGCSTRLDLIKKFDQMKKVLKVFRNEEQMDDFCMKSLLKSSNKHPLLDGFIRDYLHSSNNLIAA